MKSNQVSDGAQNGGASGTKVTSVSTKPCGVKVGVGGGASGSTQSQSRGKQGNG